MPVRWNRNFQGKPTTFDCYLTAESSWSILVVQYTLITFDTIRKSIPINRPLHSIKLLILPPFLRGSPWPLFFFSLQESWRGSATGCGGLGSNEETRTSKCSNPGADDLQQVSAKGPGHQSVNYCLVLVFMTVYNLGNILKFLRNGKMVRIGHFKF